MQRATALMVVFLLVLGFGAPALAAGPNPDCPDADNDGICNGQDPDYVPGSECRPDCPDDDNDGICNGQDPDYTPPGNGRDRDRAPKRSMTRARAGWSILAPAPLL